MDIVGICGSNRAQSFNRMVLNLAGECMPAPMTLSTLEWEAVPPFNADLLAKGFPDTVQALRERIRRADGVVIVTPEYNFSVPGMLKNLIDWISRGEDQPFAHKPLAILSATTGPLGGARVQYDLRKIMMFMNAATMVKPEVFVGNAAQKFDADAQCTDELTRKFVTAQMTAFKSWIERQQRANALA
ncbi:NAD(P)H-dependent oxidoreductase [Diaphorobacter sp. HDW4A]|uniref:NADPH-dependent FMN reductase n=1 Tax=Diaphorobacter sp. HDW4A TaxID=2714924 RepID=UPI00140D87E7|nr:NAD(P)H-dependent oxidoreductase [Diaphorobacter sp. HDW4A]QIL82570.1 NAD(P)H-dependent oxidoreductase [Diaphorobacter sp. HDW4A]